MRRLLRLAPLLVVLALAGLLAACGSADLASDPAKVLASATLPPAGPASSTLQVDYTPSSSSSGSTSGGSALSALAGGPISITATAQGDAATGMAADGKITLGPVDAPFSIRTTKDNAYLQVGGTWYETGSSLGLDIGSLTGMVGDVSQLVQNPKATAVEDVDGIQCDRISGTVAPGANLTKQLGSLAGNLPIDVSGLAKGGASVSVWVGRSDHVIHRVQVDTAGGDTTKGGVLLDISTVPSDPVTVTAPENAKPLSNLLGAALGGAGGKGLGGLGGALGNLDLGKLLGGGGAGGLNLGKILGGAGGGSTT